MIIIITDTHIMPSDGVYRLRKISKEALASQIRHHHHAYYSFISDQKIKLAIESYLGVSIPTIERPEELKKNYMFIVATLLQNDSTPEANQNDQHVIEAIEFARISYAPFGCHEVQVFVKRPHADEPETVEVWIDDIPLHDMNCSVRQLALAVWEWTGGLSYDHERNPSCFICPDDIATLREIFEMAASLDPKDVLYDF